jgi:tetratricopeptide (TPR) repeat protein
MKRYKLVNISILSSLFLLFSLTNSFGQQNRSTISGFVFDDARRPISQVIVELKGEFSTLGRVKTDGSGRFYFGGLAQGRYTVRVMPLGTGLSEQSEEIEIAGMGVRGQLLAENVQKDVYLKPRRTAATVPFQNAVVFAQEVPREAEDYYKKAIEDLDSQRTLAGIENLEKAVASFPQYFMALQRLGLVRLTQNRFNEAADIFTRAAAVNDRCFDCWYGLSFAKYSVRNLPESVTASEKAVALKQDSVEANLLLGMSYRLTRDFVKAEKSMRRAAKMSGGDNSDVHWNLALLYGKDMERFSDAANELELYLKAAPDVPNKNEINKLIKQFKNKSDVK